jgi:hypothetical protein
MVILPRKMDIVCPTTGVKLRGPEGAQRRDPRRLKRKWGITFLGTPRVAYEGARLLRRSFDRVVRRSLTSDCRRT